MKYVKRAALGLLVLVVLVLGSLTALVSSASGTRFLAKQADHWLGQGIRWQSVDGRLIGPMTVRGLRVSMPGLELELDRLAFDWQPAALAQAELRITRLTAEAGKLVLAASDATGSHQPFDPTALRAPLDLYLSDVQIRQLTINQAHAPAQRIDALDLTAALTGDAVAVEHFEIRVPEGGLLISGDTALRSQMPLKLKVVWDWLLPAGQIDPASMGRVDIPLRGQLNLDGTLDWATNVGIDLRYQADIQGVDGVTPELPSSLSLTGHFKGAQQGPHVTLEQLTLALDEPAMTFELAGRLDDLESDVPKADFSLDWQGLEWPISTEPSVRSVRGQLEFEGAPEAYQLSLVADVAVAGIPPGQWQLRGQGDQKSLTIEALGSDALGGALRARGPVSWDPTPRWQLIVEGEGVDPNRLVVGVPGELSFVLESSGQLDVETGLTVEVAVQELDGTLMDQPLEASVTARLEGETVTLELVALESKGNTFSARGAVAPEALALDWELAVVNLSALVSGAQGQFHAAGKVTGMPQAPRLEATFDAAMLTLDALTVAQAQGSLEAGPEPHDPLAVALTMGSVRNGEQAVLDGATLQLLGSVRQHELTLETETATEQIRLALEGGLDDQLATWSGLLRQLSLASDDYGSWQLAAPAQLTLGAEVNALAESCLERQDGEGAVCIQGRRTDSGNTTFAATLDDLPVAAVEPTMTGALNGEAQIRLAADSRLDTEAIFRITPGNVLVPTVDGEEPLPHGGGELRVTVDSVGLVADLEFAAPEDGHLVAQVQLPEFTGLPPAEAQPLTGWARATLPRLDILAAWLPDLTAAGGRLEADLQLAGTLAQPNLEGRLALTEGQADVPMAGLALREVELSAASNPDQPGRLDIRGGLRSGDGQLRIRGETDLLAGSLDVELAGDRVQAYNTADARAVLSPDLQIGWRDDTLRVRGNLVIPEAAITPQLNLRSAAATEASGDAPGEVLAPSRDVVVINRADSEAAEAPPAAAPFRIDSQIRVVFGNRVSVDAVGFRSKLAGAVTFTNTPNQTSLIPIAEGRIDIRDGTFRAFGQDLDIETGQLIFAQAPATEPEINVRAVRWIEGDPEITAAGVLLQGAATAPELSLFSRPPLEETSEIQSYLLTGTSAKGRTNVLSIGTYLSPRFYVGYGYNVLESTSEFNSLFNVTPRYGFSANAGEADSNINLTITYEN